RREFAGRLDVQPARPEALLEFGDLMRDNERLEEAAEAYLGFIRSADGDARWEPRIRQVRGDLHGIFLRRGDETADPARALELYAYAKGFAYDESSRAEAARRLAETYERLGRWKEAVAQYQELIEESRSLYHRPAEGLRKLWQHARERVDAIVQKAPDAYAEVEARAAEALRAARQQGGEALREVMDRFPNSDTAREAWRALKDGLLQENQLEHLRGLFKEFEERFRQKTGFDDRRAMLDVLDRLGDVERLRVELERFAADFGDRPAGTPERPETARAWAERRMTEIDGRPRAAPRAPAGPLTVLAEWPADEGEPLLPLAVAGLEPPSLPPPAGVFARGSSVELWDVPGRRRLWAAPRPWAWTGLTPAPGDDVGLRVASVEAGSPAADAGFRAGDLIVAIDGRPADVRTLWGAPAGRPLPLLRRRDGAEETVRLFPAAWPADRRPAVKAAAWGRDGSLLVVWEDGAAALDPASGRVRWTFRDIRDRHAVRAVHAADGRLLLYEAERPEAGNTGRSEDAHHRLLAVNDLTGDLAWGHLFPSDGGQGGETTVDFFGAPLAEHLALLRSTPRANVREWVLSTYRADTGERIDLRTLPGQVSAWAADVSRGVFYYVSEVAGDRRERVLQSRSIDPSRRDVKQIDVALKMGEMIPPQAPAAPTVLALAAEGDYVCLLAATGSDYRLRVFENGQLFRSLSLPAEGRMLPGGRPDGAVLQDGLLHVYNVPRDRSGGGPARAFLTAFRVGTGEPSDLVAWEAVAPVLRPAPNASWSLVTDGGPLLALVAPGGSAPDQGPAAGSLVTVYDRAAGGYLRLAVASGLEEGGVPVVFARGRLYVVGRDALIA
ncbi:MAG TPA: PDZ domain-containing protein, partial [Planctomycetota bacterium]|nr:PDZ domain-containing protein [Planctomycetota bacterium]